MIEDKNRKSNGQFRKGCIPLNKGKKMKDETRKKLASSWFQKGHLNWNTRKIGSERIAKDGYIEVKVTDKFHNNEARKNWRNKHLVIYEEYHKCTVDTKKDCVIFLDGNKRNFDIDNLYLVSRAENRTLNAKWGKWDRHSGDKEVGKNAALTVKILQTIRKREEKFRKK